MEERIRTKQLLLVVLGAIGTLGEILTLFNKFPFLTGYGNVKLGVILSLFLFVWGWLEKSNQRNGIRAPGIVCIIVAPFVFIYFLVVAYVLLPENRPSPIGSDIGRSTASFQLADYEAPDKLIAKYVLEIDSAADILQVIFTPSDKDQSRVIKIKVISVHAPTGRVSKLIRSHPKEDGVLIRMPIPSLVVSVKVSAILKRGSPTTPIDVLASYRYGRKDWKWRVKRWIFGRYW